MQPYFFPYIGYFQLINAVDTYVNLDHVSFMKRSYMTRNTLKNNTPFNISVSGASQNKSCKEVNILVDEKWFNNFDTTLNQLYGKEKNYIVVVEEIIDPLWSVIWRINNMNDKFQYSISDFNIYSIKKICKYLDIKTKIITTSEGLTDKKKNEGLQDIVKHFGGAEYINAIGGQSLYTKEDFASQNIDLKFIKNNSTLPNTSILDLLFRYDKELIKQELTKFELI